MLPLVVNDTLEQVLQKNLMNSCLRAAQTEDRYCILKRRKIRKAHSSLV